MNDDEHIRHPGEISIRGVYFDDDLIELETRVRIRDWFSVGSSYASTEKLRDGAAELERWSRNPNQEFKIVLGSDRIGQLSLRFYTVDMAGHIFCHVKMATMSPTRVGEDLWHLELSFPTEPALIDRFSHELSTLAETRQGGAVLEGVQP